MPQIGRIRFVAHSKAEENFQAEAKIMGKAYHLIGI